MLVAARVGGGIGEYACRGRRLPGVTAERQSKGTGNGPACDSEVSDRGGRGAYRCVMSVTDGLCVEATYGSLVILRGMRQRRMVPAGVPGHLSVDSCGRVVLRGDLPWWFCCEACVAGLL